VLSRACARRRCEVNGNTRGRIGGQRARRVVMGNDAKI
jgi:hypothetical protein